MLLSIPNHLLHAQHTTRTHARSFYLSIYLSHLSIFTGGYHNLIVHGTAAEAGADGEIKLPGFAVIARMRLNRANYSSVYSDIHYLSNRVPRSVRPLHARAVPCAPAESNGGQRCAALQRACASMISDLTTTLELQGVPGWPEIYGLGCCEYRLNATHSAPLVVDARQPLQTAPMWNPLSRGEQAAALATPQAAPSKPVSYEGLLATHVPSYAQYAGQGTAMSACLEATPPLSLEQCGLRKPRRARPLD